MTSSWKHSFRASAVVSSFECAVFITLTTVDKVDLAEIRKRWRIFRHDYFRRIGKSDYIQVYEPHPRGHGWHIHVIVNRGYLPVEIIRLFCKRAGFGRVHIEKVVNLEGAATYLSKYLVKGVKACKALGVSRVRLVNCSRGLTRLSDCVCSSSVIDFCKTIVKKSSTDFYEDFVGIPLWLRFIHVRNWLLFGDSYCTMSSRFVVFAIEFVSQRQTKLVL